MLDILNDLDADPVLPTPEECSEYEHLVPAIKTWMNSWPDSHSNTEWLRASSIYDVCPREFVLNYWQPKANRSFDWGSWMRMDTGTFLHSFLQNKVLGPMGILWGHWREAGKELEKDPPSVFHPYAGTPVQDGGGYIYEEFTLTDEQHRISGHIDGIICKNRIEFLRKNAKKFKNNRVSLAKELAQIEMTDKALLEIKTTSSYGFKKLTDHTSIAEYYKMQAEVYQKMSGIPLTIFWFIERDTMNSKIIPFVGDGAWWTLAKRKANLIWRSIRDETLPENMMKCHSPSDTRAKKCAHRTPCWLDDFKFQLFVQRGKQLAAQSGRQLLDLSDWKEIKT